MECELTITDIELAGGWKLLVSSLMFHAVRRHLIPPRKSATPQGKEWARQCVVATRWLNGGIGVITFEEACEVLGYDPDAFLERLNLLKTKGGFVVPDLVRRS